ncbi:MAG: hypothetical protein GYA60_01580 [Candidatus Methanofastidiosa archaeon]|nr:hypothetical protein [Candidatus Methanofastidiosa archaeon]
MAGNVAQIVTAGALIGIAYQYGRLKGKVDQFIQDSQGVVKRLERIENKIMDCLGIDIMKKEART